MRSMDHCLQIPLPAMSKMEQFQQEVFDGARKHLLMVSL